MINNIESMCSEGEIELSSDSALATKLLLLTPNNETTNCLTSVAKRVDRS